MHESPYDEEVDLFENQDHGLLILRNQRSILSLYIDCSIVGSIIKVGIYTTKLKYVYSLQGGLHFVILEITDCIF